MGHRQRFVNRDPLRKVVRATPRSGSSINGDFTTRWWDLELECGHQEQRTRRFRNPEGLRGFALMHHRPPDNGEHALPPPNRVRCPYCAREERKRESHARGLEDS